MSLGLVGAPRADRNVTVPDTNAPELHTVGLPPWLFQPRGAPTIDSTVSTLVLAATSAVLFTFTPGPGQQLRISYIGFGAQDPTALVNATFLFTTDGNPIQGYGRVPVAIGTIDEPAAVFALIKDTSTLSIAVQNNFPGSDFTYILRVVGWTFQTGGNP